MKYAATWLRTNRLRDLECRVLNADTYSHESSCT